MKKLARPLLPTLVVPSGPVLWQLITGGDPIVAAAKYEADVEFRPSFTLIVAANDASRLRDDDAGMWARMRRIQLTAQIPPERQDRDLKARLQSPEHAAAVLAWTVRGCQSWQNQGLGSCAAVAASTAEYREDMDVFARFLDECCVLEPEAFVPKAELNRQYATWCRETGIRYPLSPRELAARLEPRVRTANRARQSPVDGNTHAVCHRRSPRRELIAKPP